MMTGNKSIFAGLTLSALLLAPCAAVLPAPAWAQAGGSVTTDNVRVAETEAGNLLADAIRASVPGAEIALVPAAAFTSGASVARPATGEQAAGLVTPPSDTVVILTLRGDQIMAALERSVSFAPQPSAGFLQVSGLRFAFDVRKEGGHRVTSATVAGQPLSAARLYKVATTRPLSKGQQGYFTIWDQSSNPTDTGKSLATALTDYARSKGGTVAPTLDGRIVRTGE